MRDAFEAWKDGIPAVLLVHEPFVTLAKVQCQALGAREPVILAYPQDAPARESDDESAAKAARVATEIVRLLSTP